MKRWYKSKTIRGLGGVLVGLLILMAAPKLGTSPEIANVLEKVALAILPGGVGIAGYGRTVADGPLISKRPGPGPGTVCIVLLALCLAGCSSLGGAVGLTGQKSDAISSDQGFTWAEVEGYVPEFRDGKVIGYLPAEGASSTVIQCDGKCAWTGAPSEAELEASVRAAAAALSAALEAAGT